MSEKENLETLPVEDVVEESAPVAEEVKEPVKAEEVKVEPIVEEAKPEVVEEKPVKKADKKDKSDAKAEDKSETVALHSKRPVLWEGVGRVERGYNIVSKAQAEKWLTRDHIRLATPEEIKGALGN